ERVTVVRDHDAPGAAVAVLTTGKRGLHRALRRLGEERADLVVRVGTDVRVMETLPLRQLSYHDLFGAHWLEIGTARERGSYRIGTGGYLTGLFVEHDPGKNRYLALRKRADRTDWAALLAAAAQAPDRERSVVDGQRAVGVDGQRVANPDGRRSANPDGRRAAAGTAAAANGRVVAAVGERRVHPAEPVDVVYTWVDSGDPAWREAHRRYSQEHEAHNVRADNGERYIDREGLRYSLRALGLFAERKSGREGRGAWTAGAGC